MWAKANKIEDFNDDDLYDPETNIRVGTWYLNRALKRWSQTDDPVTFALAEYNAGRSNALKWVDPLAPLRSHRFPRSHHLSLHAEVCGSHPGQARRIPDRVRQQPLVQGRRRDRPTGDASVHDSQPRL